MTARTPISPDVLAELKALSSPTVCNALKRLGMATTDIEIFDRHGLRCMAAELGPAVGFAVTRRVATRRSGSFAGDPPELYRRMDDQFRAVPSPRILVVQNVGDWRGPVCIWGEVLAAVNRACGCVAGVTNGPVRDLPEMAALGFRTFAGGVGVGGGYVDTLDVGGEISIAGLRVRQGDLLHGDVHGMLKIPRDLAPQIPAAARALCADEARIVEFASSAGFSMVGLKAFLDDLQTR